MHGDTSSIAATAHWLNRYDKRSRDLLGRNNCRLASRLRGDARRGVSISGVSVTADRRPDVHDPRGPDHRHDASDGRAHGAVHAWAPMQAKTLTLTSVIFMGLLAGVTCVVHFCVLTLSRQPEFAGRRWEPLVFPFAWPSVVCTPLTSLPGTSSSRSRCCSPPRPSGDSPCHVDPGADDRQRGTLARRPERGRSWRHAAAEHRHSRLRRGVPRRGSPAGNLVL
jgi:hypothetical protein